MIFFAGIFICKNTVLYSSDMLASFVSDSSNMIGYQFDGVNYIADSMESYLYIPGISCGCNELSLDLENKLTESVSIHLYATNESEEKLLETREVRSGIRHINFYFPYKTYASFRIQIYSIETGQPIPLPPMTSFIQFRHLNVLQKNMKWFCTICSITIISLALSWLLKRRYKDMSATSLQKGSRDSNIELLRCICMILLVAHHYAVHGGLLYLDPSSTKTVGLIFLPVGKICFVAFVAISMYFLVDGKAKFERFLRCWLEVLFYSVALTILTWIDGGVIAPRDFISSFFVMTSNSHGFAASYLLFLLIYPFLLKITQDITKAQARYLLFVLFLIQVISQIMRAWTGYTQPVFSELTLFILCYILSLNLKRFSRGDLCHSRTICLCVLVAIYGYTFLLNYAVYNGQDNPMIRFLHGITGDESSAFYILGGYALFYLFLNTRIKPYKAINAIAKTTFGILLIHDHNFLRHIFWNEIIITETHFESQKFFFVFAVSVMIIFYTCAVIDYIRMELLESFVCSTQLYANISMTCNKLLCTKNERNNIEN